MIGEICALIASLVIASSSVLSKSLTGKIKALPLQTMRSWFGFLFLIVAFFVLGKVTQLPNVTLFLIGMMAGSAVIGVALGDTLYMRIMQLTEISKAFPVVRGSQILLATLIGAFLFQEEITWPLGAGAALIICGVYLATSPKKGIETNPGSQPTGRMKWLPLAVIVGACWAFSWGFMKIVLQDVDPLVANTVRMPIAIIILTSLALSSGEGKNLRINKYGRATMWLIIAAGVMSYGVGMVLMLNALHIAGISRTAVLTSTTPLFILGLSAIFLKERMTWRLGLGTVVCVAGIVLVVLL